MGATAPTDLAVGTGVQRMSLLSPRQRDRFEQDGWVLASDVLSDAEVAALRKEAEGLYPSAHEFAREPQRYGHLTSDPFAGVLRWPTGLPALDWLPLHPSVIGLAQELVGATQLRLLRASVQIKIAGAADYAQTFHYDFEDQCLIVPTDKSGDRVVGMFLFLSDIGPDQGPTAVVSQRHTGRPQPERREFSWQDSQELLPLQKKLSGPTGTLLSYRTTTYHRATQVHEGFRLTYNLAYAPARPWYGYQRWETPTTDPVFARILNGCGPRERMLLSRPGDKQFMEGLGSEVVHGRHPALRLRTPSPLRRALTTSTSGGRS